MTKKIKKLSKRNDIIFYVAICIIPLTQFAIFYIGVNINSVLMAFQKYSFDPVTRLGKYQWAGFDNFADFLYKFENGGVLSTALLNSFLAYAVQLIAGLGLSMVFSYYIFKKMKFSGIYKVMLFIPSILSSVVVVLLFNYFSENALPYLAEKIFNKNYDGFLSNPNTAMGTLLFFCVWSGFGTMILMFSGAMNGVNEELLEAASLDGCSQLKEFFFIVLPMIYPTIVTFLIVGVSAFFSDQIGLYSFYGKTANIRLWTIGYWLFNSTREASLAEYCGLAAASVILTAIAAPLTILARYILNKFGPSVD